jgi:hypothetical protein
MRWTAAGALDPTFVGCGCTLPSCRAIVVGHVGRYLTELRVVAFIWESGHWAEASAPDGTSSTGGHTGGTVALPDGRVVCVGGRKPGHPRATTLEHVQMYDPVRQAWQRGASMPEPRESFSATVLADGAVLVCGGCGADQVRGVALVHRYLPTEDRWVSAADLPEPRSEHLAARLEDGSVLVAGGLSPRAFRDGGSRAAFRYLPADGHWELAGELLQARKHHVLLALRDGRAVVLGGWAGQQGDLDTIEVFDPATGQWALGGVLLEKRKEPAAALISDGRVLVTGGIRGEAEPVITASTEIWDPRTGISVPAPQMLVPRYGHELIPLLNGRFLAVGGLLSEDERDDRTEVLLP